MGKNRFIFGVIKDYNMPVNFIILLNIRLFWFPAGQGLKKVILVLFKKVDKITNGSDKTSYQIKI